MADGRMRDRAEGTAPPARRRAPESGDVARALFAEHLDLDAIRRALGQRAAPESAEPAAASVTTAPAPGADLAPDQAPLGRDLPRAKRPDADVPAAVPGATAPRRRVSVRVAASLGGLIAATVMLGAWTSGNPEPRVDALPDARPPTSWTRPDPLASVPTRSAALVTTGPLAAVSPESVGVPPSPVPIVQRPAAADPLPRPDAPAGGFADPLPGPRLPFVVASAGDPEPVVLRRNIPSLRSAPPIEARTPPAPIARVAATSPARAGEVPVLARAAIDERPAAAGTAPARVAAPIRRSSATPAATPAAAPPAEAARGTSRVVVHAHGAGSPTFREGLTDSLRRAGFDRVEWRAVADTVSRTQTRFFHAGDKDWSDRAAEALAAQGRAAVTRDFTHYDPPARRGTIEVWLGD